MAEARGAIDQAVELILASRNVIAMTGAGMSVESGIPPFRGEGGLWTQFGGPDANQYQRFLADPDAFWARELQQANEPYIVELRKTIAVAAPNPGHVALASLESEGVLTTVVTQNIDGLHQAAGSKSVIEMHGSRHKMRCVDCGDRSPREAMFLQVRPAPCVRCGGRVKYDSVLFGEPIPRSVLEEARAATDRADCVLVVGTSATVRPAGGLPRIAKSNGARLIEVNPDSTAITETCDVVLRGRAAAILPELVAEISLVRPGHTPRQR